MNDSVQISEHLGVPTLHAFDILAIQQIFIEYFSMPSPVPGARETAVKPDYQDTDTLGECLRAKHFIVEWHKSMWIMIPMPKSLRAGLWILNKHMVS